MKNEVCNSLCMHHPLPNDDTIKLLIEYKKHEIELAKLQLELQRGKESGSRNSTNNFHLVQPLMTTEVNNKSSLTIEHKNIRNFGDENCDMLNENSILAMISTEKMYGIVGSMLKFIHFNDNYTENHNLKMNEHDRQFIHVYYENSWSKLSYLTVIDEYIRGNLQRIKQLINDVELYDKIEESIFENLDQVYNDFLSMVSPLNINGTH